MFPLNTRFLIVDDFATMRKIIRKVLAELGYMDVVEARDGKAAHEALIQARKEAHPVGFVISDWNMPEMTGLELLKACKADPNFRSLPFMLVTAESEQKNIVEAARCGVSDYVIKPFNSNTLKGKLERIWTKHSANNTAA